MLRLLFCCFISSHSGFIVSGEIVRFLSANFLTDNSFGLFNPLFFFKNKQIIRIKNPAKSPGSDDSCEMQSCGGTIPTSLKLTLFASAKILAAAFLYSFALTLYRNIPILELRGENLNSVAQG